MFTFLTQIAKKLIIWLHLSLVGAWNSCQEQIWDRHKSLPKNLPQKNGQTLVITGGGRGIGYEAVIKFLSLGYHVILGVRNPNDVLKKFTEVSVEAFELDLTSLDSVRSFAQKISAKNIPINVLVNNAGIMFGPRRESKDGFEMQLATNHLGHFLLTHLLLPKLREAGTPELSARIINVSSCAHHVGSWIDWNDLHSREFYSPQGAYGISKAAQIMSTIHLNKELEAMENCHVTVNSLHPGVVRTELYQNSKYVTILNTLCCGSLMKTPKQGGDTLVHAVAAPEIEGKGGLYFENSQEYTPKHFTRVLLNQVKLWNYSCEACNIEDFFDISGKK